MADPPPFDPSKPFSPAGAAPPAFDPSKPHEVAGASEKVFYNDAGQPFTLSGRSPPPAAPSDQSYTGSLLPLRRDASGLHLAVPESVASPFRGAVEAGKRLRGVGEAGQNPLRPLSPDELSAVGSFGQVPFRAGAGGMAGVASTLASGALTQERAALAREAMDTFGIPITASQIGTSNTAKIAESAVKSLPLSGARAFDERQKQAFYRAVSRTFGEDADALTQTVMSRARSRIGGEINRIENAAEVKLDDAFMLRLAQIEAEASSSLVPSEFSVIEKQLQGVLHNIQPNGSLKGVTYGNLLGRNSPLDQAARNTNSNISRPAQQIKDALQDALQRSLSGDDLAAYRQARFQYKNMKTIEPLVNKAVAGDISPALLNSRVTQQFPNRAFDTSGSNPLDRLGKIAQAFLKEPGTSTTAERAWTLARLGEMGAAAASLNLLGLPATIAGTAGTLGAGRLISSMMRSPWLAKRAIEKGLNPPLPKPPLQSPQWSSYPTRAAIPMLLNQPGGPLSAFPRGQRPAMEFTIPPQ